MAYNVRKAGSAVKSSNDGGVLHVVFICDENYVMPTVVAISSIYANKKAESTYCIHVICSDVSENSRRLFDELNHDGF